MTTRRAVLQAAAALLMPAWARARGRPSQELPPVIRVGDAHLHPLRIGDVTLPLGDAMRAPLPPEGTAAVRAALHGQVTIPLQGVLVRLPGVVAVIDAGAYDVDATSPYHVPGHVPPPDVRRQLAALGVQPDSVQHVVITHRHWDHFNGTTHREGATYVPSFPRARHYLGRADWNHVQPALADPTSREARALGVLQRAGLLDIVDGDREIARGLSVVAAPGETAGHQLARVASAGETFYAAGDLYHHPVEVAYPGWMVSWSDQAANLESRRRFVARALAERAGVLAAHIPAPGRLAGSARAAAWVPL